MDRKIAEPLLIYVNDKHFMDAFKVVLESKIILAQKNLTQATDLVTMGRAQGEISALTKLLSLDVEVKNAPR